MEQLSVANEADHPELARIIQSNHRIRKTVQEQTNKFLILQNELLKNLRDQQVIATTIEKNSQFFNAIGIQSLNEHVTSPKVQLALVGANSCGKTSFLHLLLRSGSFLPADVGSVSARIIHLTYADGKDARLYVYSSLNNKEINEQVDLSQFCFDGQEPDWEGIKEAIRCHVARPNPENIEPDSDAFAEWAKLFVEIQIPSSFLKIGIDIYDTPGLLFSDPPVLKENLRQLVELVHPTLVFMYDNAAVSSDAKDCFFALKDASGQLIDTSIFFLNTKADIDRILRDADPNNQGISDEKIPEILLHERQKRYQLLLDVPSMASEFPDGLPKSLMDCSCFDIVSVHSEHDDLGAELNQRTINRIIQFAANSDLKIATKVSRLVLPVIDACFDFALVTSHRTMEQLQQLRHEARQWAENYFIQHRSKLEELLTNLYHIILNKLNNEIDCIAHRAAQYKTAALIEKYVRTVVQQEIIKVSVKEATDKHALTTLLGILTNLVSGSNANKNEVLIAAQRSCSWLSGRHTNSLDNISSKQVFIFQTILLPTVLIADILVESDDDDVEELKILSRCKQTLRRNVRKKRPLERGLSSFDIAHQYLSEMHSWLIDQKPIMSQAVDQLIDWEKEDLISKIDQYFNVAVVFLSHRQIAYQLITRYTTVFACIECKIAAAMDLAKFDGRIPQINGAYSLDERVYSAEWTDNKNLIVKKSLDHLEAHYHRKITQLEISHSVPLLYLYEEENTGELWMFFPKYIRRLNNISLTVDKIFKIVSDIASALVELHQNEIVHRNIKIENIWLDEKDECYLADFDNIKCAQQHEVTATPGGTTDDVDAFGQLGMFMYEFVVNSNMLLSEETRKSLTDFENLLRRCIDPETTLRPKSIVILKILNEIRKIP